MELLGPSLWDVWNGPADQALSEQYVACVAVEALTILEHLHGKGCARQLPRPCGRRVAMRARAGGRPAPPGDRAHTRAPACAPCGAAGRPVLALAAAPRGAPAGAPSPRARAQVCARRRQAGELSAGRAGRAARAAPVPGRPGPGRALPRSRHAQPVRPAPRRLPVRRARPPAYETRPPGPACTPPARRQAPALRAGRARRPSGPRACGGREGYAGG